jgi:hypothetical protein
LTPPGGEEDLFIGIGSNSIPYEPFLRSVVNDVGKEAQMKKKLLIKLFIILLCLGTLVVTGLAVFFWKDYFWYDTRDFEGDGEISAGRFWSYPRYRIVFGEIDLAKSGEHKMSVKRLPPAEFTLGLLIPGNYGDGLPKGFNNNITASIADDEGRILSQVSAPVNQWKLSRSIRESYLWHPDCRQIPLSPRRKYTITISINATESNKSLPARPFIAGGGNELP